MVSFSPTLHFHVTLASPLVSVAFIYWYLDSIPKGADGLQVTSCFFLHCHEQQLFRYFDFFYSFDIYIQPQVLTD